MSVVYEPGAIYDVKPITRRTFFTPEEEIVGAKLYVHARPGVTKEYLERQLSCHAVAGQPAHPSDPLNPSSGRIAEVDVHSAGGGFSIHVIGEGNNGKEIFRRAMSIKDDQTRTPAVGANPAEHATL